MTWSPADGWFAPQVLRNYALVADGERGGLIGPNGEIAWMCVPRWHSEAVFSSLIGGRGIYAVTPDVTCVWGGSYEPGSLIWRNRWVTTEGAVECHDTLVSGAPARLDPGRPATGCTSGAWSRPGRRNQVPRSWPQ